MHVSTFAGLGALAYLIAPGLCDEFIAPLYDFLSRPDIHAERVTVTHYDPHGVAPGYIFLTPWAPEIQRGVNYDFAPSIYDNNGELVWTGFNSSDRRAGTQVFFMTEINGQPALAYYHFVKHVHPSIATVLNNRYEVIHNVGIVDTQNLTWTSDGESVNGLAYNISLQIGNDLHDLNVVTRPARTAAWPAPGIDPVEVLEYEKDGHKLRRKRSLESLSSRELKFETQTTALMTFGRMIEMEKPFFPCKREMYWLHTSGFQEISLDGKNTLLFQWDPAEHVPINESYVCGGDYDHGDKHSLSIGQYPWHSFDFFHRNSIDKDANGDYYLSARHTRTIYKISKVDGSIIWRLGGHRSDFEQISNVSGVKFDFAWQHDARLADVPGSDPANGIIGLTMWDNANNIYDYSNKISEYSAGKTYLIDERNKRAVLTEAYTLPDRLLGVNQGSHQLLPNGNHMIGGGNIGMVAEYRPSLSNLERDAQTVAQSKDSPSGELVFAAHYGAGPMNSYRAKRYDWHGFPTTAPALFGYAMTCPEEADDPGVAHYYVSWNGATEVAAWVIYGGSDSKGPFEKVAETHRTGFESVATGSFAGYTYAVAYDTRDHELGGSQVVRTWVPSEAYLDVDASAFGRSRYKEQIVLNGGSCSSRRCTSGFDYKWTRAKTCPGLDPPPAELDLVTDGWTEGGWHMDSSGVTVSVTRTYTKDAPPPTKLADLDQFHGGQDEDATSTTATDADYLVAGHGHDNRPPNTVPLHPQATTHIAPSYGGPPLPSEDTDFATGIAQDSEATEKSYATIIYAASTVASDQVSVAAGSALPAEESLPQSSAAIHDTDNDNHYIPPAAVTKAPYRPAPKPTPAAAAWHSAPTPRRRRNPR